MARMAGQRAQKPGASMPEASEASVPGGSSRARGTLEDALEGPWLGWLGLGLGAGLAWLGPPYAIRSYSL